jgi:hypothetical protein
MKFAVAVFCLVLFSGLSFAQNTSVENDFEKNKLKLKLERFSEGEDASSGFDYLIYKDKSQVVKIREIWSSSANSTFRVEDYFFKDGQALLLFKYTLAKSQYKNAVRGKNVPLKLVEKLYLTNSKLTKWVENSKIIPITDKRWPDKEKEVLEATKSQLENYTFLKKENE